MTEKKMPVPVTVEAVAGENIHADEKRATEQRILKKPAGYSSGLCVYLGPSIRGVIQSGRVFPMAKELAVKSIAPAIEAYPLIAELIVSGDTLPVDRIKVKTPGNLLYVKYQKLAGAKKYDMEGI